MHPHDTAVQLPLFVFDGTKRCSKCGESKAVEQFYRQAASTDGLHRWCKVCCGANNRARYAAKGEEIRAKARAYYQEHREDQVAYSRSYRAAHPEQIAAYNKAYSAAHTEERKAYNAAHLEEHRAAWKRWYAANHEKQLAYAAAYHAEHREEERAYNKAYKRAHYAANRQRYIDATAEWVKAHPERAREWRRRNAAQPHNKHKRRLAKLRRRARAVGAGGSFSVADIHALAGAQAGLCYYCAAPYGRYHIDHKTPLSRGGTNAPDNLALTCARCNLQKHTKTEEEFREWVGLRTKDRPSSRYW